MFKSNDNDKFKQDIIGDEQISEAFEEFKRDFEVQRSLSPVDQFELSQPALKKGKKHPGNSYTVKNGDTLGHISEKTGVPIRTIRQRVHK